MVYFSRNTDDITATTRLLHANYSLNASSPATVNQRPSNIGRASKANSISEKFSLAPDPRLWGSTVSPTAPEPDDFLHNPDVRRGKIIDHNPFVLSQRGIANIGCLVILVLAILALFAGYPIINYVQNHQRNLVLVNTNRVNATGQVAAMTFGLIDQDTPTEAYTHTSLRDGSSWQLVFSDEFNTDGRSFYPGDDPYWEAVDLHYWQTGNMEWYDPAAITTSDGSLVITFQEKETHGLNYQGGMMTTWNKFCFTGGYVEAKVMLPGINNVVGMWPAIWALGNLGRAGYGASLDGMWPYSYDACDVGTTKNQTKENLPAASLTDGWNGDALSYLPGQRLSRCTCEGESHPGPKHSDGTYVGRAAPEIDIFEAQVSGETGQVSQSAQWAPFNDFYIWDNATYLEINDRSHSVLNDYKGGNTQQATSVVTNITQNCYELADDPCYAVYGFEYKPGYDDAYITWVADGEPTWTLNAGGMGADNVTQISARPISQEPMYLIINLGMSTGFGTVDLEHLTFPNHLRVDYIRVYQDSNNLNVGCDPKDYPTAAYINTYKEAYTNPNLTTWVDDYKQPWPKNSFIDSC